jgi:ubiquinone/menaquinone biosynthesis C-methylase UbiE
MNFDSRAKTWDSDPMKVVRANKVAEEIRAHVPLAPHMSAFEYGCGTGLLSFALQPYLKHITLADSSSGMLAVLQEKIGSSGITNMRPIKLDLVSDPLPQERYHLIYTLMTFHHVPDTDSLLRDMYSLLASPGYLCVADLDSEDGSFHGPDFTGHRGFDREELRRKASEAGFRNIDFSTVFNIRKAVADGEKDFPVFLLVAEKP